MKILEYLKNRFKSKKYLYHGTTFDALEMIKKEGLDPKKFKRGFISLTDSKYFAAVWKNFQVVLAIDTEKLDVNKMKQGHMDSEVEYHDTIPFGNIEVMKVENTKPNYPLSNKFFKIKLD